MLETGTRHDFGAPSGRGTSRGSAWRGLLPSRTRHRASRPDPIAVCTAPTSSSHRSPLALCEGVMVKTNDLVSAPPGRLRRIAGWLLVVLAVLGCAAVVDNGGRADPDSPIDGDEPTLAQAAQIDLHSPVWSLAFSPDGARLATSTVSNDVWLMDDAHGVLTVPRQGLGNGARSLAFSPDGRVLAIGGPGRIVRLVDASSASELAQSSPKAVTTPSTSRSRPTTGFWPPAGPEAESRSGTVLPCDASMSWQATTASRPWVSRPSARRWPPATSRAG